MEIKYLDSGLLNGAKKFNPHLHSESELYIKKKKLIKILKEVHRGLIRERMIIKLSEYQNDECSTPCSIIYTNKVENSFAGLETNFYKEYCELDKIINSLSFQERFIIAKKIALLIESFEKEEYSYYDLHLRNLLVKGTDIMLIDMDGGKYASTSGIERYKSSLKISYYFLPQLILSILYNIRFFPFADVIGDNLYTFKKNSNTEQWKIIRAAITKDPEKLIHTSDHIDSFTEDFIAETKPMLKYDIRDSML